MTDGELDAGTVPLETDSESCLAMSPAAAPAAVEAHIPGVSHAQKFMFRGFWFCGFGFANSGVNRPFRKPELAGYLFSPYLAKYASFMRA